MTSSTADLIALGQQYYLPVYRPREVILERGQGSRLWDREGREYVDFAAGKNALLQWLERHSRPAATGTGAATAGRRHLVLAERHNRIAARAGSLQQRSCMPGT